MTDRFTRFDTTTFKHFEVLLNNKPVNAVRNTYLYPTLFHSIATSMAGQVPDSRNPKYIFFGLGHTC